MGQGIQVWDASGNLIMDTSTRVGTLLGVIDITSVDGYQVDAGLALGTPFWSLLIHTTGGYQSIAPTITVSFVSGAWRIVWTWKNSGSASNPPVTLVYGVY